MAREMRFWSANSEVFCKKVAAGSLVDSNLFKDGSADVLSEDDGMQISSLSHCKNSFAIIKRTSCAKISKAEMYF